MLRRRPRTAESGRGVELGPDAEAAGGVGHLGVDGGADQAAQDRDQHEGGHDQAVHDQQGAGAEAPGHRVGDRQPGGQPSRGGAVADGSEQARDQVLVLADQEDGR